jgi:hypothetical protein
MRVTRLGVLAMSLLMGCSDPASNPVATTAIQPSSQTGNNKALPEYFGGGAECTGTEAVHALNAEIQRTGAIYFLSREGHWQGTDCDEAIVFLPDGKVTVIGYFDALIEWSGTYTVHRDGTLALMLSSTSNATTAPTFPPLTIGRDVTSLWITTGPPPTNPPKPDSFWPFRSVRQDNR